MPLPAAGRWCLHRIRQFQQRGAIAATVGSVNELLDGHLVLDLECLDRIYLDAYVHRAIIGVDGRAAVAESS